MDDAHDAETEPGGRYLRLPWPLVAAGLLGLLAIALAVGLFANRALRPQVGPSPTAPPAAAAALPTAATTLPPATSVPTPEPARTAPVLALATASAGPSPTLAGPSPFPTTVVISTPAPSALPTVEPQLADEVGRAYVNFWRVRSQAALELDATHLSEVMDGEYLQNFASRLSEFRTQGRAIKTQVILNYKVVQVADSTAIIVDRLEDTSFYVLPGTEQPLDDPVNDVLLIEFKFVKADGVWRVVDSVRQE